MGKDDWYFLVSTLIGVGGLFGIDWKGLWGKVAMSPNKMREVIILLALLASLGMSGLGWYKSTHQNYLKWTMSTDQEEVIYGKHYFNERVEIDGKKFDHCSFNNTTLLYHGSAFTDFIETSFSGTVLLITDNEGIGRFEELSASLAVVGNVRGGEMDKNGNLEPIPSPKVNPNNAP